MKSIKNRLQNTELALLALWVNIRSDMPKGIERVVEEMMEDYFKSQISLGSKITTSFIKNKTMELKKYQEFTQSVALYPKEMEDAYLSTGLAAEAGELCTIYAKYFRGDFDKEVLKGRASKEIGDVLWFLSQICNSLDFSLQDILEENVNKLTSRKERGVIKGDGDER